MLKKALPVTWDIFFNGNEIFSNAVQSGAQYG